MSYSSVARTSGSQAAPLRSSFSPSSTYNPSVNESHRNILTDNYGGDDIDDDGNGGDADAMSLEDQRRGALQEAEDTMVDPDFGKPYFQTRRGKLTLAVVVIVLIVVAAVIGIVVTRSSSSSASKTIPTPTSAPYSPRPSKLCGRFPVCTVGSDMHALIVQDVD